MKVRSTFVALVLFFTSGCATTPIATNEALDVPRDRVINASLLVKLDASSVVVVKRDAGFIGATCTSRVFVNAVPVADLARGEKVVLYLPEGEHLVGTRANGICAGGLSETRASIMKGRTYTFRIGYGSNGEYSIQPTAF